MKKDTPTLAQWQQQFIEGVHKRSSFTYLTATCNDQHTATFNLKKRLAAYDANYQLGLTAWLKKTYPQVVKLVGDPYFAQLAQDFSDQQPLSDHTLHDYGRLFPRFIANTTLIQKLPYLADVAQVDASIAHAYYAATRATFDIAHFSQLTETEQPYVTFILADDLHIMASDFPLYDMWQLNRGELDSIDIPQKSNDRYYVAMHRELYQPSMLSVGALQYQFYHRVRARKNLSELLAINTEFADLLSKWIQLGWIVGFEHETTAPLR